jgi:histidinol-phosphate aminotransferase
MNPSSVSALSQAAASTAMEDQETAHKMRLEIKKQRDMLSSHIAQTGLNVLPSQTNFVLVDFGSADNATSAFEFLRRKGIVVRPMSGYGLPGCLRITIGNAEHMQLTAKTLGAWRS